MKCQRIRIIRIYPEDYERPICKTSRLHVFEIDWHICPKTRDKCYSYSAGPVKVRSNSFLPAEYMRGMSKITLQTIFHYNQVNESRGRLLETAHYVCQQRLSRMLAGCGWVMPDILHIFQLISSVTSSRCCLHTQCAEWEVTLFNYHSWCISNNDKELSPSQ